MCSNNVREEAQQALAELLADMAQALAPGEGGKMVIGPVDFGMRETLRETIHEDMDGDVLADVRTLEYFVGAAQADEEPFVSVSVAKLRSVLEYLYALMPVELAPADD